MSLIKDFASVDLAYSQESRVEASIVLALAITGIFGISLVLFATKADTSPRNKLIWSLCFADLLLCSSCLVTCISNLSNNGFSLGDLGCFIQAYTCYIAACGSVFSLIAFTIERYASIMMRMDLSETGATLICFGLWILDFALVSAVLLLTGDYQSTIGLGKSNMFCLIAYWNSDSAAMVAIFATLGIIFGAIIIITFVYVKIFMVYRSAVQKKRVSKKMSTKERILLRKSVILVSFFVGSYTPLAGVIIYEVIIQKPAFAIFDAISIIFVLINSSLNPFLIIYLDRRIQLEIIDAFPFLQKASSLTRKVSRAFNPVTQGSPTIQHITVKRKVKSTPEHASQVAAGSIVEAAGPENQPLSFEKSSIAPTQLVIRENPLSTVLVSVHSMKTPVFFQAQKDLDNIDVIEEEEHPSS